MVGWISNRVQAKTMIPEDEVIRGFPEFKIKHDILNTMDGSVLF